MCVRTDRDLGKLCAFLDQTIGMRHVLVALTADHGVIPLVEELQKDRMPGGRMNNAALFEPMRQALADRFGPGACLLETAGSSPYLNL